MFHLAKQHAIESLHSPFRSSRVTTVDSQWKEQFGSRELDQRVVDRKTEKSVFPNNEDTVVVGTLALARTSN